MAQIHFQKNSFAGGEFAPGLQSRTDIEKYPTACKRLKNVIVHPHGSVSNRAGLYYVATTKYDGKDFTTIPFEYSTVQNYVLEFGDYYVRFYANNGQVVVSTAAAWVTLTVYAIGNYVSSGGTIYYCNVAHTAGTFSTDLGAGYWTAQTTYEVPTPYSEADIPYLNYTQSADVLYLWHGGRPGVTKGYAPRTLSRYGATDFRLELYDYQNGPFMLQNTDTTKLLQASAVTGVGITLTATGFTFQTTVGATHIGSLWQMLHNIEGQAINLAAVGQSAGIKCGGTWRCISHGTWTGAFAIEKSTDGGTTWTNLRTFTGAADFNANTYGTEDMSDDAEPFLVRINITAGTPNVDLTTDPFVQKGIVKITAVAAGGATATADVKREIGLAATNTVDWSEGAWSDYRGWPSVVEFHSQDRLVSANTVTEPQTSWITKTGNYLSYARSDPLVASDGITVNLPSRKVNGINGLVALTELIALTSSSEWGVSASDGVLSPTTIMQRVFGYEGSKGLRPLVIGNRAIYVQAMGQVIRDLGFELQSDSFTGGDLSVLSNHLFTGYTITDMTYQQNPDRLVWCVRSDGKLLSMTYMREQEVVAWTWHDTNQSGALAWVAGTAYVIGNWVLQGGLTYECAIAHTAGTFADDLTAAKWVQKDIAAEVKSCSVIPAGTYDQLWVGVKRGTKGYIERMVPRLASTAPEDQIFMDSAITYSGGPAQVIGGLTHLEGKTVTILADGNVLPQQVVSGGQITLDAEYSKVHVGIPYTSDIETLNIEVPLRDGTLQGRQVMVSQIILRLLNSRGGWIGPDFDNLHEINDSVRSYYGTALPLVTADVKENLGGGYTNGARICFRQIDPLPFTLLALIGVLTPGDVTDL